MTQLPLWGGVLEKISREFREFWSQNFLGGGYEREWYVHNEQPFLNLEEIEGIQYGEDENFGAYLIGLV